MEGSRAAWKDFKPARGGSFHPRLRLEMRPGIFQMPGSCCPPCKLTLRHAGYRLHAFLYPAPKGIRVSGGCVCFCKQPCQQPVCKAHCLQIVPSPVSQAPGLMAGCLGSRTKPFFLPRLVKADGCLTWARSAKRVFMVTFSSGSILMSQDGKLPPAPFWHFWT